MTSLGGTAHYFPHIRRPARRKSTVAVSCEYDHSQIASAPTIELLPTMFTPYPCLTSAVTSNRSSHSNPLRFRKFTMTYIGVDHPAISFTPALVSAAIHCESLPFFQVRQSRGISLPERRHCTQDSLTNLEYCLLLALCNDRLLKPSRVAPDVHVRLFFYLRLV